MSNQILDSYRRSAMTAASGLALEIGVGSGLDPRCMPRSASRCSSRPSPGSKRDKPVSTEDHRFRRLLFAKMRQRMA
jgi:hypothetical protein